MMASAKTHAKRASHRRGRGRDCAERGRCCVAGGIGVQSIGLSRAARTAHPPVSSARVSPAQHGGSSSNSRPSYSPPAGIAASRPPLLHQDDTRGDPSMAKDAIVSQDLADKFKTEKDSPYLRFVRGEGLDIISA